MSDTYPITDRTTATRDRGKMSYQRDAVHAVLDEAYHGHLAFIADDAPQALPMLHVRVGETVFLHGSTGGRIGLDSRRPEGLPVCLAVTLLDGLVYARSQSNHSANYRSVIVHGVAKPVTDPASKQRALNALMDKAGPGRAADSRPPTRRELAETAVLALPLRESAVRSRTGGVNDDPADLALPHWAGVVPLRTVAGPPLTDPTVTAAPPDYLPGQSASAPHLNG